MTNLYEYYNNNHNYESQINRIVQIEITDSSSKVVKLFTSYIPKDFMTKKHLIDLSWCVEFYDFPQKLKKAYFEKPDIVNQKDGLFLVNIFNKDEMLSEHFYIGSIISGIKPETMRLEYIQGTNRVKKITDSVDGSNYNFEYDVNDNISSIDHLTKDNKRISQLIVIK